MSRWGFLQKPNQTAGCAASRSDPFAALGAPRPPVPAIPPPSPEAPPPAPAASQVPSKEGKVLGDDAEEDS